MNTCRACTEVDPNALTCLFEGLIDTCSTSPDEYAVTLDQLHCVLNNPTCVGTTDPNDPSRCASCPVSGTFLDIFGGSCVDCGDRYENCVDCDSYSCTECDTNYELDYDSTCVIVPDNC